MYDTLIIGSGPAGTTAGLYAVESNLKAGTTEQKVPGRQTNNTSEIEDYPEYGHTPGPGLSMNMHAPLEKFGVKNVYGIVKSIGDAGDVKCVTTEDASYEAKTIILVTGAKYHILDISGEEECTSRGVSYCIVYNGTFFRNRDLLVVGGGDSIVEEAVYFIQFAKFVTIIHRRDELRAQKILQDRAFANDKINFIWDSVVRGIRGTDIKISGVTIENVKTGELSKRKFGGIPVYVGVNPVTSMVVNLGVTDEAGWVITDERTTAPKAGIFAIGSVRQKEFRQIATAVGDGAIAEQGACQYIEDMT